VLKEFSTNPVISSRKILEHVCDSTLWLSESSRIAVENGWHHVLNRGIDGWQLFPDDRANEHRRRGPLFQGRFKAVLNDPKESGLTINRYIHLNPVRIKRLGGHEARAGADQRPGCGKGSVLALSGQE
jgi:hypothetical protein